MHGRHEATHTQMECQQWCWRWPSSMRQRKSYWQRGANGLTCQQSKYVTTEQSMLDGPMRLASARNAPLSSYKLRTHVLWCSMSWQSFPQCSLYVAIQSCEPQHVFLPPAFIASLPNMYDECRNCLLQVVILVKVIDEANPPEDCLRILATVCIKDEHGKTDPDQFKYTEIGKCSNVYRRACKSLSVPFLGRRFSMAFRTLRHKMLLETPLH